MPPYSCRPASPDAYYNYHDIRQPVLLPQQPSAASALSFLSSSSSSSSASSACPLPLAYHQQYCYRRHALPQQRPGPLCLLDRDQQRGRRLSSPHVLPSKSAERVAAATAVAVLSTQHPNHATQQQRQQRPPNRKTQATARHGGPHPRQQPRCLCHLPSALSQQHAPRMPAAVSGDKAAALHCWLAEHIDAGEVCGHDVENLDEVRGVCSAKACPDADGRQQTDVRQQRGSAMDDVEPLPPTPASPPSMVLSASQSPNAPVLDAQQSCDACHKDALHVTAHTPTAAAQAYGSPITSVWGPSCLPTTTTFADGVPPALMARHTSLHAQSPLFATQPCLAAADMAMDSPVQAAFNQERPVDAADPADAHNRNSRNQSSRNNRRRTHSRAAPCCVPNTSLTVATPPPWAVNVDIDVGGPQLSFPLLSADQTMSPALSFSSASTPDGHHLDVAAGRGTGLPSEALVQSQSQAPAHTHDHAAFCCQTLQTLQMHSHGSTGLEATLDDALFLPSSTTAAVAPSAPTTTPYMQPSLSCQSSQSVGSAASSYISQSVLHPLFAPSILPAALFPTRPPQPQQNEDEYGHKNEHDIEHECEHKHEPGTAAVPSSQTTPTTRQGTTQGTKRRAGDEDAAPVPALAPASASVGNCAGSSLRRGRQAKRRRKTATGVDDGDGIPGGHSADVANTAATAATTAAIPADGSADTTGFDIDDYIQLSPSRRTDQDLPPSLPMSLPLSLSMSGLPAVTALADPLGLLSTAAPAHQGGCRDCEACGVHGHGGTVSPKDLYIQPRFDHDAVGGAVHMSPYGNADADTNAAAAAAAAAASSVTHPHDLLSGFDAMAPPDGISFFEATSHLMVAPPPQSLLPSLPPSLPLSQPQQPQQPQQPHELAQPYDHAYEHPDPQHAYALAYGHVPPPPPPPLLAYGDMRPVNAATAHITVPTAAAEAERMRRQEDDEHRRADGERRRKDRLLLQLKHEGYTYREIREKGAFAEAESTLRGRFRTLTKAKQARVRRPQWTAADDRLLVEAVDHFAHGRRRGQFKIAWKAVADRIVERGGSYHFGNTTCRKRYDLLTQLPDGASAAHAEEDEHEERNCEQAKDEDDDDVDDGDGGDDDDEQGDDDNDGDDEYGPHDAQKTRRRQRRHPPRQQQLRRAASSEPDGHDVDADADKAS